MNPYRLADASAELNDLREMYARLSAVRLMVERLSEANPVRLILLGLLSYIEKGA